MKRKHPLRRIMIGIAGTTSAVVLLLALKQPGTSVAGSSSQAGGVPPAASASAGSGLEAAGGQTVLGDVADTQYGPVQVQLTLSDGRITAATAVKAPGSDANSRKIAAGAVPELNQAVVAAQSAQIDAVSGATYTSQGYIKSLQSAIDKAEAAGAEEDGPGEGAGAGAALPGPDAGAGTGGSGAASGTGDAGSGDAAGTGGGGGSEPAAPKSVVGAAASTQYGDVQVRITVSGGRITAADAVKAPDSDANSRKIAARAVPELNQAAVAAQSAQIDAVSGASYTSEGYIKSLQSAIDKAGL
ncbi:FMN-binding protein [Streptomyces sp. NPDC002187]|uniref:FMN-binding protein n=1 Tax=Streptomyces sp. NPDC002187 TaxID=3364637 RepID=UPI00369C58C5